MSEYQNLRKQAGLTHKQVGRLTGASRRTITYWGNDDRPFPDYARNILICYIRLKERGIDMFDLLTPIRV